MGLADGRELIMCCGQGAANGRTSNRAYVVTVAGSVNAEGGKNGDGKFASAAEARIWIANNVKGVAATVKAVVV